jgi:osmotically-inducible protein OsmY
MKTDARIKQDILNALRWNPQVTEEHIGVTVHNGAVTLTGHVPTYWEKTEARQTAKDVSDVRVVVDNIEVRLASEMKTTDEDLAERIANVLNWNVSLQGKNVKAEVRNGRVRLTGEVEWHAQRANIERNIEHVSGVASVVNLIVVKPRRHAADVTKEIRDALERHADIEASRIAVDASNGTVTLSGTVESLAELARIEDAAWAAPGISRIVNNIRVVP